MPRIMHSHIKQTLHRRSRSRLIDGSHFLIISALSSMCCKANTPQLQHCQACAAKQIHHNFSTVKHVLQSKYTTNETFYPLTGKSKSQFHLNRNWITRGDLICLLEDFDLKARDMIWIWIYYDLICILYIHKVLKLLIIKYLYVLNYHVKMSLNSRAQLRLLKLNFSCIH